MITIERVLRIITNNQTRYFSIKQDRFLITPNGITFNIFYQLLCQDLKLYSTMALQSRRLDKGIKKRERNKLMAVHAGLDMAEELYLKHKQKLCPPSTTYTMEPNRLCIYRKNIRSFVIKILLESLNIIEEKGTYHWKTLKGKTGLWREFIGNKLIPIGAEVIIDKRTQKTYIKFVPNMIDYLN